MGDVFECPGSRAIKQPVPDILECPKCKGDVEMWSDEFKATCPKCKTIIFKDNKVPSCVEWCKFAKDCVGAERYEKYMKKFNEAKAHEEKKHKKK